MCNKNSRLRPRGSTGRRKSRCLLLQNDAAEANNNPDHHQYSPKQAARRSRTKTRRPKFLSLRVQLSNKQIKTAPSTSSSITDMTPSHQHHQLNLFPLHPENLVNDVEDDDVDENRLQVPDATHHDENDVVSLFHSDGGACSSLNSLLIPKAAMSSEEQDSMSSYAAAAAAYGEGGGDDQEERRRQRRRRRREDSDDLEDEDEEDDHDEYYLYYNNSLVRTAMRNRERDLSEEKWVCYSEVVEEATSSTTSELWRKKKKVETTPFNKAQQGNNLLALKLDYQGILNAWSDKGSLYIQGDSPQTVPDLQDQYGQNNTIAHILMDGWGTSTAGNLWKVPVKGGNNNFSGLKIKEEVEGKDGWKTEQREASVLRYKEKRQSRLFAKRIRYEVRKLNAEKRPRMKGRFVKIS